jgi:hypothetical protein
MSDEPRLPTCGQCYMIVCSYHKRIIEQCDCVSASKRRVDVPCPGCWGVKHETPTASPQAEQGAAGESSLS